MAAKRLMQIGKVGRPHGTKGEIRVFTDDPESDTLGLCDVLLIGDDQNSTTEYPVERARPAAKFWIVKLTEVGDRDGADRLKHQLCFVDRDSLPELEDGWYADDLVGLTVVTGDEARGKVRYLFDNGAHLVMVFQPTKGSEVMIPFTDEFVGDVDLNAGTVEVFPYEESE